MLADPAIPAQEKNASLIPAAHKKITACERDLAAATAARKALRSKIPATSCAPARRRPCSAPAGGSCSSSCGCSRPTPSSTSPTTSTSTCTTTRKPGHHPRDHPAGLGGTITYTAAAITVTLDRPSQPKIARALACLLAEINTTPPVIPGDHRPIAYQLAT